MKPIKNTRVQSGEDSPKPPTEEEYTIREHRKWTRWVKGPLVAGKGNLVLTNRRLIFLHRIAGSPKVAASVKRLADAPITQVLDYAISLDKKNFQIPLSRVLGASVILVGFFTPRFCLRVRYLDSKGNPSQSDFNFQMPFLTLLAHPQSMTDWAWAGAINRAVKVTKGYQLAASDRSSEGGS